MNTFAGLNYFAVVLAAVASFMFGGLWYGLLAKPWMAATGKTEADVASHAKYLPYVVTFAALLVMAWIFAGVLGHLGAAQFTLRGGLISALFLWAGFVATTLVVNGVFQGAPRALTLIDGGHWLGVMLIQGAVLGAIGPG